MKKKFVLFILLVLFYPLSIYAIKIDQYEIKLDNQAVNPYTIGYEKYGYQGVLSRYYEFIDEQGKYNIIYELTNDSAHLGWVVLNSKKEKEKELMLAYPEIVSKLCLLIGSGLTVRRSWERIIKDYKEAQIFNYAYEEMLLTYYELERGIPEGKAYAAFGRRCRQHGYRKLGSLLEQNLKKGTSGLLALLQEETWQAFEERRAFAVKLAQEAGTRLLFPMVLLLLVVLIICVAPAIMSF